MSNLINNDYHQTILKAIEGKAYKFVYDADRESYTIYIEGVNWMTVSSDVKDRILKHKTHNEATTSRLNIMKDFDYYTTTQQEVNNSQELNDIINQLKEV